MKVIIFLIIISICIIVYKYKYKEDLTIIYNIESSPNSWSQGWVDRYNQPYNPRWMFLRNYFYPVS